jgi:hypothetical protein
VLINDLNIYPLAPVPVTPPAGEVFEDPTFGTPILRITDAADGENYANNYSAIYDTFNTDSSRFTYVGTSDGFTWTAELDVAGLKFSNKAKVANGRGVIWSRVNPNLFYSFSGMQLYKYDFTSAAWTLIKDFTALFPGQSFINNRGMSWNDRYFHISFADGSSVSIYDQVSDVIIGPVTLGMAQKVFPGLQAYDWGKTTMDASGQYVVIATGPALVYNIRNKTGFVTNFGTPANQYGDVHPDFGPAGMVANAGGLPLPGPNNGIYPMMIGPVDPTNLSTYLTARKQIGPRTLWGIDTHSSFRDGLWNTLTYDAGTPIGADANVVPIFNSEIFQLSPNSPADGSINRRIVRHCSNPQSLPDPAQQYWAMPKGNSSQDGRVLGYNSTYVNGRIDVYVAFIAEVTGALAGVTFTQAQAQALLNMVSSPAKSA